VNSAQALQPSNQIWPVVWKLLRLRALILINGFRRAKLRARIGMILAALLVLVFLGVVFYLSWTILGFMRDPQLAELVGDVTPFVESLPVLMVSGTFIAIMLTSIGVLLQALYLAGDMDFLLSAPVPIRAVFLAKLLQAILPNFGLIVLFTLPVLFGLAMSSGYSWLYYPLVLIMLSALALAAAGLSSLLVMLIVRVFPARRVAELLGFLGAILSFMCSQSSQLARWGNVSTSQFQQALNLVTRLNAPWSPLAWAGRGLVMIGQGEWGAGFGLLGLVLLLCVGLFGAALVTSEHLYTSGWASLQVNQRKKKTAKPSPSKRSASRLADALDRWRLSAVWGIIHKDLLVLRRDVRNMSQLVTPFIIGIVYFIMMLRGGNRGPDLSNQAPALVVELLMNVRVYASVGLSLFVGWMLLGRLAGMGFAQEGRSYWLMKTAPVRTFKLIAAKYLVAYMPTVILCGGFLLITMLIEKPGASIILFALPVTCLSIAGNTGINLAFGIAGANMNWEDPRQMQRSGSGCLGSLVSMLYLPTGLFLFFGPPIAARLLDLPEPVGQLTGLLVGGVFSLMCAAFPLWLVQKKVNRLGET
jgi:hypothetical protein